MSIFSSSIDDIFNVPQFQQTLTTSAGTNITVISYQANQDTQYTQYGVDNGDTISITCKTSDITPTRGDKVTFRNASYKVADYSTDSHNLTYTINLKSVESK